MTVQAASLPARGASRSQVGGPSAPRWRLRLGLSVLAATACVIAVGCPTAIAEVGWSVVPVADPSHFSSSATGEEGTCRKVHRCDRYQLEIRNVGNTTSSGPIEVIDKLPPGVRTTGRSGPTERVGDEEGDWECSAPFEPTEVVTVVACSDLQRVTPEGYASVLKIPVEVEPTVAASVPRNEIEVTGGGATEAASTAVETPVGGPASTFELTGLSFSAENAGGGLDLEAGSHPYSATTTLSFANVFQPPGTSGVAETQTEPVENPKTVIVELPLGFAGDPQATPTCPETALIGESEGSEEEKSHCPPDSRIGVVAFSAEGDISASSERAGPTAIYNMKPSAGYPAEFAFAFAQKAVYMYASVVHTATGYRLRVAVPGVPAALGFVQTSLTFFGDPAAMDGAGSPGTAFLTNPSDCGAAPVTTRVEADSWEDPERWVVKESTTYPQLTGCNLLQFNSSLEVAPLPSSEGGSQAPDEPSGYAVDVKVPQTTASSELSSPEIKSATVTWPEGVSLAPPAAQGLVGCPSTGAEGINIGSTEIAAGGRDVGEPEATELGTASAGSPYDDGLYHIARGHCPEASTLGTVEIFTPILPNGPNGSAPLRGHVYLAQPKCGGEGQAACSEASATNGELFGAYIEAEGSGVIVKLAGTVAANLGTGQLQATFDEAPQLPFSELVLRLQGGPRAQLANPQVCGEFTSTAAFEPWSSPETPGRWPSSPPFAIQGCPAQSPFAPAFSAGTTTPTADAYSSFTLTFSRRDGEQDLKSATVTLPPGLLGMLSRVALCGEPQAESGSCPPGSEIGKTTVAVGAGEDPLQLTGKVYLTAGYKGAPFGLSIVVPANAGPFHLGNVVVRAAISVNLVTAALTVTSAPLPQLKDGIPLRLRTVNVTVDRPEFVFNPTNCKQQEITATLGGAQGASATVASLFTATGCANLRFDPSVAVSTEGRTSKVDGASLAVKIVQQPGEAHFEKADFQLPLALPSRLTTLQQACSAAEFDSNPAGCPIGSDVGSATAVTPVLNVPLSGPAYLVSHGGAAFPDLEFVLQGEGVEIVLDGKTDIRKGITYSNFETLPDAPIRSFETEFPEGPHSILAANRDLCLTSETVHVTEHVARRIRGRVRHVVVRVTKRVRRSLPLPIQLGGQNGVVVKKVVSIAVIDCPTHKTKRARRGRAKKG